MLVIVIIGASLENNGNLVVNSILSKFGIQSFFAAYYAFLLGIGLKKIKFENYIKNKRIGCIISFIVLLVMLNFGSVELNVGHIQNIIFYTIVSIAGWIFIYILSEIKFPWNNFLEYAGRKSIWIVGLHFLSFKIVSYIYVYVTKANIIELAKYPVISKSNCIWIAYTIVGIIVPLCIAKVYENIDIKNIRSFLYNKKRGC